MGTKTMSLAPTASNGDLPELCRICILRDTRAKATFADNTILVINSTGSAFQVTTPDGKSTRQLSEYALTRHSPLLAAVLEFRNMHVELPCFCKPLARILRPSFSLGYLIRDVTWPTPNHAVEAGLAQVQADGKVSLSSEDGVAQVVLHSHYRRFAICYPLLVAERPQEGKYDYVWQTQVFSTASHPQRWQPAVRTALQAAASLGQAVHTALAALNHQHQQPVRTVDADVLGAMDDKQICMEGAWGANNDLLGASPNRRSDLPRADDCIRSGLAEQLRSDGWWGEPSLSLLPSEEVVMFEWTPAATYQFLPEAVEVEAWVHADESCLSSTQGGRFLAHYKDAEKGEQLYAASCVPDAVWSRDQSCRYPLAPVAAHALKLRMHNTTMAAVAAARMPANFMESRHGSGVGRLEKGGLGEEAFAVVSNTVVEESSVPGHGEFKAYEDGRVRVCFDDRTVLHMSTAHTHCKVVQSDGRVVVVAVANPVGVERYVLAAVEFARWAFKSPQERSHELRLQARVQAEIQSSQRMATMCEYSTTRAFPISNSQYEYDAEQTEDVPLPDVPVHTDRQAMIEKLLSENARLLQRLQG